MRKKNEKIFWDMEIIGNRRKKMFLRMNLVSFIFDTNTASKRCTVTIAALAYAAAADDNESLEPLETRRDWQQRSQ